MMEKSTIKELLRQYASESLSESERRELLAIVNDAEHRQTLEALLEESFMSGEYSVPETRERAERLSALLQQRMGALRTTGLPILPAAVHRVHLLKKSWFRYAAIVLVLVGAAIYFWTNHHPATPQAVVASTIVNPDRATLTLANGQQIYLDRTKGNIIHQGALQVTNSSGRLNYEGVSPNTEYHTLSTPRGAQYQLTLPDGTKVWLNAASSIKFPTSFEGASERKVEITGEAYFEVPTARSAKKTIPLDKGGSREATGGFARQPFIVSLNKTTQIQVLSTSFNVKGYLDEPAAKTTLLEGAIKINNQLLKPGQSYSNSHIQKANIAQDIAWKNGVFNFDGLPLPDVLRQLARWYDIEVVYEKGIPDIELVGEMQRNLKLEQALNVLKEMEVHYKLEGRKLIIMP